MRKIFIPAAAVMVLLFATGCPVGLDYPLGNPGQEKIDKDILGTWEAESASSEVVKVKIAKASDTSYDVTVLERGEMYALETDHLTGWVTELNGGRFFFLKPDGEEKFYHYQYRMDDNSTAVVNDLSLLDGGVDAVHSTEDLRKQVTSSMGMSGWAEEKQTFHKAD